FVIAAIGCATAPPAPRAPAPSPQAQNLVDPRLGWKGAASEAIDRRFAAAWQLVLAGDFENARKRLAEVQSRDAGYAPATLAEAAIELQEGKADAARAIAEWLAGVIPQYTADQLHLAEIDVVQDRIRTAYDRYCD